MKVKSPDIRIVNLYRKAVHMPDLDNDSDTGLWLATDYFDAFEVQEIDPKRLRFGLIEAINAKLPTMHDVAIQSFPLVYENGGKHDDCCVWGDPFDEEKEKYPFLSIIQVYITPEALARNDQDGNGTGKTKSLLESYYQDIYDIARDFHEKNKEREFRFKIYRSLSAGDFAVVICSKEADISYCISTAMRKRRAGLPDPAGDPEKSKQIVIYKTYTILTIFNSWIQNELETGTDNSQFILRCCYSNKYWSRRSVGDPQLEKYEKLIAQKLNRLNGRYDFSVSLSDQRFGHLFEDLQTYKLGKEITPGGSKHFHQADDINYDEADYLHYLITNQYLSYINERFSFSFTEGDDVVSPESVIMLEKDKAVLDYTDLKNLEYLKSVQDKCRESIKKVREMPGFHKNLDNNMQLLGRLIRICSMLNSLSDMRIYCTLILGYLEVLLDNLDHYCMLYGEFEEDELVSHMDAALGSVIFTINAYVDYVRNNNLQSMQTPNYNIESNLSIEKYLIGYTGFIEKLLQCYKDTFDFLDGEWAETGGKQNLVPVVVPQAENENLTVQVFFGRRYFSDREDIRRLMVVKCPTFSELTNIAEMTATLIHETAHQFRYEKRKERNEVIMRYIARKVFDRAATELMKDVHREFQYLAPLEKAYWDLNDQMADTYLDIFYPEISGGPSASAENSVTGYSLKLLTDRMVKEYKNFIDADKYFYEFDIRFRHFLDTVGEKLDYSKEEIKNSFCILTEFKDASGDCEDLFQKTIEAVETLGSGDLDDKSKRACEDLLNQLTDMKKAKNHSLNKVVIRKKEEFYNKLYQSVCSRFCLPGTDKKDGDNKMEMEMEAARYLGVDFESDGNRKVFKELVERKIQSTFMESMNLAEECVYMYRELTADLFMVRLLELDLFGYLLASVRNLPMGKIPHDRYLRRIALVLFLSYSGEEDSPKFAGEEDSLKKCWEEIVRSLWEKALTAICGMLNYFLEEISSLIIAGSAGGSCYEILEKITNVLTYLESSSKGSAGTQGVDDLIAEMGHLRDRLETAYASDKSEYLRDMLTETTTYCNLLNYIKYLSMHGMRFVEELDRRFKFLEKDLMTGCRAIGSMRDLLQKGDLASHIKAVSDFYNRPYEDINTSDNNLEMLRFIQEMFYGKKIKAAEEIISYGKK